MLTPEQTGDLVLRAQRGQADAFAALVRAYLRAAYAVALSVVKRPPDAEDVAQESFLKAFQRLDTCREPERFVAWLLQIVRNRSLNLLESRRLRDVVPMEGRVLEFTTTQPESAGMRHALLEALGDLDERQREVVLLHDLENWTHAEIAAALDISEVMSRQHLFKARHSMRAKMGDAAPLELNHGRRTD